MRSWAQREGGIDPSDLGVGQPQRGGFGILGGVLGSGYIGAAEDIVAIKVAVQVVRI